jgi:hypothetical protein
MPPKSKLFLNERLFHKLLEQAKTQFRVEMNGELFIVSIAQKSYFTSEKFIGIHELKGTPEILDYKDVEKAIVDGSIIKFKLHRKVRNKILRLLWLD